jgi:hypothetical protein
MRSWPCAPRNTPTTNTTHTRRPPVMAAKLNTTIAPAAMTTNIRRLIPSKHALVARRASQARRSTGYRHSRPASATACRRCGWSPALRYPWRSIHFGSLIGRRPARYRPPRARCNPSHLCQWFHRRASSSAALSFWHAARKRCAPVVELKRHSRPAKNRARFVGFSESRSSSRDVAC